MSRVMRVLSLAAVCLCAGPAARDAGAQYFGRNKVEYVDFDFKILDTEHFLVYYYSSEEQAARMAARLAERWYARLSRVLGHTFDTPQPLILYGSQPEFAQTNVVGGLLGEGIGGVTEAARRRIVMPFAPTMGETDRILGHEIAHAFQFDMVKRHGGVLSWPLWAVEGMAQYLSLGAADADAAMWLRDAVAHDLLPRRQRDAARHFSPYRYGYAMWAYLAGRFGDDVMADVLKAGAGTFERRLRQVTGTELDRLFADWREAAAAAYRAQPETPVDSASAPLLRAARHGNLHLGPSLSPDGRHAVFFSEKDRLSLDLFLADTQNGGIRRKLATTTATARFESLQPIRSSGSWSPEGDAFVFAAIAGGRPSLVLLDMVNGGKERRIEFQQLGQVFTPAWSPDGRAIAFSGLKGGFTDLYIYDLETDALRQLTDDPYADLQPAWSPDGARIAFATDRFSSDLATLDFGPSRLAIVDVGSGDLRPQPALGARKQVNPQWSADGRQLYFVADPDGISNVYRVDVVSAEVYQVTDVPGGITGLTATSPTLSVASGAPVMVFTLYRSGKYEMAIRRGDEALRGRSAAAPAGADATMLPPVERAEGQVQQALADSRLGPAVAALNGREYPPDLFLEAIGQPYVSSGGGPFGSFVRGGGSLLFSDMLGERKLSLSAQAGSRLRDLGIRAQYLNRERRWNWGAVAELLPSFQGLPRQRLTEHDGQPAVTSEGHYFERMQLRTAGLLAYALNQIQRVEFEGGAQHIHYRHHVQSTVRSLETGRVLDRASNAGAAGSPATIGEMSVAFVADSAVFGATNPILGTRSRFEVASAFGDLSFLRVLLDHRRYVMPVKPYTIASRVVHLGQYGRDAGDPRLLPTFLGSRQYLRGYGWRSIRCEPAADGNCDAFEEMLGSRLLVGNLEVRVPLMGAFSREIKYGRLPIDAFAFADSGLVWSRPASPAAGVRGGRLLGSVGAGVRVNALGMPLEVAVVRAVSAPARGWSFDFSLRTGF